VTIAVSGTAERPALVHARVRFADGSPCAPTYASADGRSLVRDAAVDGAFSLRLATTPAKAGRYRVCVWLARSVRDPSPLAAPLALGFRRIAPLRTVRARHHERSAR
jgi:hypothetical protein